MADENEISERMQKFSGGGPAQKRSGPSMWVIGGLLLMTGGLAGVTGAAFIVNSNRQSQSPADMPETSTAGEFQNSGLDGLQAVDEPPQTIVVRPDNSDEMQRLQSTIAELETQLQYLRDNPTVQTVTDETALLALREELTTIRDDLAENQQAFKDQAQLLAERDRQIVRLETDLETARLMADQNVLLTEEQRLRQQEEERRRQAEERRRAELEQRRAEEQALLERRINSPIVAFSTSSSGGANGVEGAQERYSGDEGFRRNGAEPVSVTQSEVIANPSNTVVQGTLIEGTLETGILSDLAGNVVAVVSYDVYSFDMTRVLIPRGSKLYGRYSSDVGTGQKRVLIAWDRIITTDGQSVSIAAYGSDRLGRSGLPGKVDNHFFERFGTAALISVIGAIPGALTDQVSGENNSSDVASVAGDIRDEVLGNVGDDFSSAVDDVMSEYLSIPPTISVDQGAVVMIRVNNDLELF